MRLREAKALFSADEFSGTYYLAGYAVECALKACIARSTQQFEFPDRERVQKSYSHKPGELLKVAGLGDELHTAMMASTQLQASWSVVLNWSEQSRYVVWSREEADAMLTAISHPRSGVFVWITRHW